MVYLQDKNKTVWEATLKVANSTTGEKILYELYPIKEVEAARKPGTSSTDESITQPAPIVNNEAANSIGVNVDSKTESAAPIPMMSERTWTESVTNCSLLATALESVAQTDEERSKLQKYRKEIASREAEEQKLRELREEIRKLSFARGPRDKQQLADLREEAQKAENRLNIYDKRLLRLEASKPLMDVMEREKQKAYRRAKQKGRERVAEVRDTRNKAEARKKIRRVIRELDKIFTRGDKKRKLHDESIKETAEN